ncbi:hypothetical protein ACTWQF_09520 [Streptomyces sp. 8N114]|uniref:hypothetical protein n=1 Tax=Streptomyces sp. 8N114 TaxID=3457419 RepID=UPI003FD5518B
MEMRRYSHSWGSVERWLLSAYWALSGYGLRASRALVALAVASFATVCLMMAFGLPNDDPKQEVQRIRTEDGMRWVVDKPAPKLTLPFEERLSAKRLEKSLRVTLNSVVFKSSGQDLTTVGTYVEMASRFTEPVLLGLAALAIRSRVKRGN